MKTRYPIVLIALIGSVSHSAELPRSMPEVQGISSAAVLSFVEAVDEIDSLHSFMLVRHGQVVTEGWWSPYRADARHSLYSLSKSFTSTAVGLAIAEGKLSLDDEVLKFFPNDAPSEPSSNLKDVASYAAILCKTASVQSGGAICGDDPHLMEGFGHVVDA